MTTGIFEITELSQLGDLANPSRFTDPIQFERERAPAMLKHLEMMLLIRYCEEAIAQLVNDSLARCPCHLGIGQEAVAAGISEHLKASDRVFGAHRSHSHFLALGGGERELMSEILGKAAGCSKGMGGSMHLLSPAHGFWGSVPIVGATIPIACGAGLALKMDSAADGGAPSAAAVSYFGDGASEEGVFHESLNLAAIYKLPVLFVCENNLYSSHLDIKLRQPTDVIARFAAAHRMPALVVDGNDVEAVSRAAARLLEHTRAGKGPVFLEAVTYRWRGHVGPNEDIDVGVRRRPGDLTAWKARDPVARLFKGLNKAGAFDEEKFSALQSSVRAKVAAAVEHAKSAPYPPTENLMNLVYNSGARA